MHHTKFDVLQIPAMYLPGFRSTLANQNKVANHLLFRTWGGLGDQICAEPTLRYALKTFKNCRISLESERPELFSHLKFDRVYAFPKEKADHDKHLVFETITPPDDSNMVWQFFSHLLTNCVDFPALCALRMQLPIEDRQVILDPPKVEFPEIDFSRAVIVHAGKHWQSKTFPKKWWDAVLSEIQSLGGLPVLIGANTDDNRGTVDVDTRGCIDLRNKVSILGSISLLSQSKVLLTNDSSPLHMAVPFETWIGFIATAKHPDHITHYRKGGWSWRMQNLGKGGIWDIQEYCPNKKGEVTAEFVDEKQLLKWLPKPGDFARWGVDKLGT